MDDKTKQKQLLGLKGEHLPRMHNAPNFDASYH